MLSIIVCSISPELLSKLAQSIEETIGVEYELIAIDNRQDNRPIAQVYNEGARKARYPYLFFVHEDVLFHSKDWGAIIERKLAEPDCGVVGFAGCKAMMNTYGGWAQYDNQWLCAFYFANISGRPTWLESYNVKLHTPYEQVVTLDGFAFFVRRDVWAEFPFDEDLLTGFHCYDVDFSLQVGRKYKNYVCGLHIWIEHLSPGQFSEHWVAYTVRLYRSKWKAMLPVHVPGIRLTPKEMCRNTEGMFYRFLFKALRTDVPLSVKRQLLGEFWRLPFSWAHLSHCFSCTLKFVRTMHVSH